MAAEVPQDPNHTGLLSSRTAAPSLAFESRPIILTKGAVSAKYTPGCVIVVRAMPAAEGCTRAGRDFFLARLADEEKPLPCPPPER